MKQLEEVSDTNQHLKVDIASGSNNIIRVGISTLPVEQVYAVQTRYSNINLFVLHTGQSGDRILCKEKLALSKHSYHANSYKKLEPIRRGKSFLLVREQSCNHLMPSSHICNTPASTIKNNKEIKQLILGPTISFCQLYEKTIGNVISKCWLFNF